MAGPGPSGRRVLLVEDDDDSRELMAEVLVVAGHAVHPVASGRDAVRVLSERLFDVLVTDLGLPGMGGLELARVARAVAPAVRVVVVTGWAEQDDVERARGREVDAVLLKPVDPESLTAAVAGPSHAHGAASP